MRNNCISALRRGARSMTLSNYIHCNVDHQIDENVERHDHGCADGKGRKFGCKVFRGTRTYTKIERDPQYPFGGNLCRPEEVGLWYTAEVRTTRDGGVYGAS